MKKFNILFIIAIVTLLMGCAEEARLEHLNVTLDKDTYYAGEMLDINATFYVTVVDNNGAETVLGYDALGQSGYAIAGLESAVLDKVGKNDVTLQYFVTSNSNGAFYNYGEVLSKKTSLTVIEPKKSNISSISFTDGTSVKITKDSFNAYADLKFGLTLDVTLNDGTKYNLSPYSSHWDVLTNADGDIGLYVIIGSYKDHTTDAVKLWVID